MPAIEAAQQAHAEEDLDAAAGELDTAVQRLRAHSDPVPFGVPAATRTVAVEVPDGGSNARLRIVPAGSATRLQVAAGESPPSVTVVNATVRPLSAERSVAWNETLTVRAPTRLRLQYRQVDGRPVVTVSREFK